MEMSDTFTLESLSSTSWTAQRPKSSHFVSTPDQGTREGSIIETIQPHPTRLSNDTSSLTLDKLNFRKVGLHGRDKEVKVVQQAFDRLVKNECKRSFLWVSGFSGAGKSRLVYETLKQRTDQHNGIFAGGKIDWKLRNQRPYAAFVSACSEICGVILRLQAVEPELHSKLCSALFEEMESEIEFIVELIPALQELIGNRAENEVNNNNVLKNSRNFSNMCAESKNRFNFVFSKFIRIVSHHVQPVVLVMDDAQWADTSTLELLEVLVSDRSIANVMMVGIYRSNEVDDKHILSDTIRDFELKSVDSSQTDLEVSRMTVGDLELGATRQIVCDLLSLDDDSERTQTLSEICQRKTHGNAFYLLQFLASLYEKGLLHFDWTAASWKWKIEEIVRNSCTTNNVNDLLMAKMDALDEKRLVILRLASCLGSSFEFEILRLVWNRFGSRTEDEKALFETFIDSLEMEGYIAKCDGSKSIRWEHDKLQEAALLMTPEKDRPSFSQTVGEILRDELDFDELNFSIFVVVNLLNNGPEDELLSNPEKRIALARLNCKAAQTAMAFSAFATCAEFSKKGIDLLPADAWSKEYELSLILYSIGAKAESFIGNLQCLEDYYSEVLSQNTPLEDKLDIHHTWIDSRISQHEIIQAQELLLDIIGKLNCRLPKNPIVVGAIVVRNILRIKLNSKDLSVFSTLRPMTDKRKMLLMKLFDKLLTCLFQTGDARLPVVIFRMLNWTIRFGYSEMSPVALGTTGLLLTGILNDIQTGSKYGDEALRLLEKVHSPAVASRTIYIVYTFLYHWVKPLRQVAKLFFGLYDKSLQAGDVWTASYSIFHYILMSFLSGTPLQIVNANIQSYIFQMKDLKQEQVFSVTQLFWQVCLNLMGRNNLEDPIKLVGDAVNEERHRYLSKDSALKFTFLINRFVLLAYFGRHVESADLTAKEGVDCLSKGAPGVVHIQWETYLRGLSCFAAAQQTGKAKYKQLGQKFRRKIKSWLEQGNPNVAHYEALLDAEKLACDGKHAGAVRRYELAILLSARGGHQSDAALASERLGQFFLSMGGDEEEARYRLHEAAKYWKSWGALGKVHALEEQYPFLVQNS